MTLTHDLFLKCFAAGLSSVVEQVAGRSFTSDVSTTPECGDRCLRLDISGGVTGHASVSFQAESLALLGKLLMGEPIDGSLDLTAELEEAAHELLRQALGLTASELRQQLDCPEIRITFAPTDEISTAAAAGLMLFSGQQRIVLALHELTVISPLANPQPAPEQGNSPQELPRNLELLLDMELDAVLRFGQREMAIREILEIAPGDVIELDREVNDPADLLIGGVVVARGEVVIVDGNFGLRIQEIASPERRLQAINH